jgi:glyoxylase-like metal-dependent hydrolase (beta-lactamase superfamily II)
MKLSFIETGFFKLDGGAMFGIVPKRLWSRVHPADENNMCTWSMRCLLIETGDRKILVDTGIGTKQDEKFRSHFEPHGDASLFDSLAQEQVAPESITDVFLTHLHFDHVGGAVSRTENGDLVPTFPNATYWSNQVHWNWAVHPNPREKASFLKENFIPLEKAGQVKFLDVQETPYEWLPGIKVQCVFGHTEAMMILHITHGDKYFVYCADLLPSHFHLGGPYVMSYDMRPLKTMEEKQGLLEEAVQNDWKLGFEHDPTTGCISVERNEKGRIAVKEKVDLASWWNG